MLVEFNTAQHNYFMYYNVHGRKHCFATHLFYVEMVMGLHT